MAQRLYELKVEDVKRRIEIEKERLAMGGIGDAYHAMKPTAVTPEFIFKVRPAVNGGFVLMMDNDMFIAANAEELAKTVVTAMVRKKIFSGL